MMRRERWKFDRAGSSASPAPTNAESRFQRLPLVPIGPRRGRWADRWMDRSGRTATLSWARIASPHDSGPPYS